LAAENPVVRADRMITVVLEPIAFQLLAERIVQIVLPGLEEVTIANELGPSVDALRALGQQLDDNVGKAIVLLPDGVSIPSPQPGRDGAAGNLPGLPDWV
jgi:hypothetical protein